MFICIICNFSFSSNCNLTKHLKTHIPKQQHQCRFCEKTFVRDRCLIRHVNAKHVINENTTCPNCNQRFHTSFQKDSHVGSLKGCKARNTQLPSQPPPLLLLSQTDRVLDSQIVEHEIIVGSPAPAPTSAPAPVHAPAPAPVHAPAPVPAPASASASEEELDSEYNSLFPNRHT